MLYMKYDNENIQRFNYQLYFWENLNMLYNSKKKNPIKRS